MAKLIFEGWSKPGDDIPQPTSIIMGKNLRLPVSKPPLSKPPHVSRPFGHDLSDIAEWCRQYELHLKLKGEAGDR